MVVGGGDIEYRSRQFRLVGKFERYIAGRGHYSDPRSRPVLEQPHGRERIRCGEFKILSVSHAPVFARCCCLVVRYRLTAVELTGGHCLILC